MSEPLKIVFVITLIIGSVIGFMIKLPRIFYHVDKELHALFYCSALLFLSVLYPKRWRLILVSLIIFGFAIEVVQDYSNIISMQIIGKRIHGRFDIQDIYFNLSGITIGIIFFGIYRLILKNRKTHK